MSPGSSLSTWPTDLARDVNHGMDQSASTTTSYTNRETAPSLSTEPILASPWPAFVQSLDAAVQPTDGPWLPSDMDLFTRTEENQSSREQEWLDAGLVLGTDSRKADFEVESEPALQDGKPSKESLHATINHLTQLASQMG